jgi:hypothetical protein
MPSDRPVPRSIGQNVAGIPTACRFLCQHPTRQQVVDIAQRGILGAFCDLRPFEEVRAYGETSAAVVALSPPVVIRRRRPAIHGFTCIDTASHGWSACAHHECVRVGYSGHKHQKGEKVLAIVENNGFVLAPLPVAPVNEADTVLPPDGLNALKRVARLTDLKIDGSYLNLDGGFDSRHNRKAIFNAGLVPNIKENPRNRKTPKRGRKRLFNAAIHSLRLCVERTFAWEDKFKRLLLRFEFKQQRHYGMKLMAYTLINLRHFCGA